MVKYIKCNKAEYPVKFGMNASFSLCELYKLNSPDELASLFDEGFQDRINKGKHTIQDIKLLMSIAYVGLEEGHRKERLEFDIALQDVVDMTEEDPTFLSQVLESYMKAQVKPDPSGGAVGKRKPRKK